jgi:predicted nucleic acid-binding protein
LEVANVIVRAENKYNLPEVRSAEFVQLLQQLRIQIEPEANIHLMNKILKLARLYKLSAYDAAYLELALREKIHLATLDEVLIKAAKKANVKIIALKKK